KNGTVSHGVFWEQHCIAFKNDFMYIVLNSGNSYYRDYLLSCLCSNVTPVSKEEYASQMHFTELNSKGEFVVNIIGDTYPGEYYSERRTKRGRWDPLVNEGYDYSFSGLKDYLRQSNLNIINLEAALVNDLSSSRLWDLKKFVLGGDPEKTIRTLINNHIHGVLLANNHLGDYEADGVLSTISCLKSAGLFFTGAGMDFNSALKPLRFTINGRKLIIFNAYWFRTANYRYFDFYPGVNKYGVNVLDNHLMKFIRYEKEMNPDCIVIVSPHWGVDFQQTSFLQ
ncbi:TPA: hypothetical protein JAN03_24805, partial [Citrobacter freundii]|nr:hypothetical protein [Citrobacter freundii]